MTQQVQDRASMYPAGEERGSVLVQESRIRMQSSFVYKAREIPVRPKGRGKPPSKIWHFCYNSQRIYSTYLSLDEGPMGHRPQASPDDSTP